MKKILIFPVVPPWGPGWWWWGWVKIFQLTSDSDTPLSTTLQIHLQKYTTIFPSIYKRAKESAQHPLAINVLFAMWTAFTHINEKASAKCDFSRILCMSYLIPK